MKQAQECGKGSLLSCELFGQGLGQGPLDEDGKSKGNENDKKKRPMASKVTWVPARVKRGLVENSSIRVGSS